ncbi:Pcc1-domain-containing protein [Panus rudis PR-1116 ss-1]|nr:Pcc1-domain-containing protein [Panus rudis PR-1116 ss-1]
MLKWPPGFKLLNLLDAKPMTLTYISTTIMSTTDTSNWHTVTIRVPFASEQHALIAKQAIEVDKELQPDVVHRSIEVEKDELVAKFTTLTVRLARLTVNAFLDNVELVVRTLGEFGEDAARKTS